VRQIPAAQQRDALQQHDRPQDDARSGE